MPKLAKFHAKMPKQVKVESPNKNGRLTGRINWHKSVNASTRRELDNIVAEPYLLPKHQISNGFLPPKPPRKEDYTVDFTQMLASDIKLLEQLEAEHLERATKVVPKSTASNSPIHQIIETQNPSQKMTKNVEFQVNDVTATQKTIRKPPNPVSFYPDETLSFESNTKVTEEKQQKMPVCASCGGVIRDVILQALGHCFHPTCFRCTACRVCLDGVPFAVNSANDVFCMKDYEKATIFPICAACGGTISASNDLGQIVRIVAQGKEYHIDCYNCEGCGLQLSNEAHSKCYPLKTHSSNHLLCKTCHLQWRRLSESLQTPITDL
uniref:LIM zinc-binding domain-containing protein n=1 Tax=Ditylenchus dipsaci TaxID=166011 RepID=A0A915E2I3_9BILA